MTVVIVGEITKVELVYMGVVRVMPSPPVSDTVAGIFFALSKSCLIIVST